LFTEWECVGIFVCGETPKRNGVSSWISTEQGVPSAGNSSLVKKLPAFMEADGSIPTTVPYSERDEFALSSCLLRYILILSKYRPETLLCPGEINNLVSLAGII
jgi:hypothetical protein